MKRSTQQQKAIEVYCRNVAEVLNENEIDLKAVLTKKPIPVKCTQENIKENLWKPIQVALFNKKSSKDLERLEVSEVYDHLNRWLIIEFGEHIPFPSNDDAG